MRTANQMPNLERVKEALIHNADGTFTWKERPLHHFPDLRAMRIWNTKYKGKIAKGSKKHNGYIYLTFDNKGVASHRLAWYFHNSECDPKMEIDHLNGIRDDNRIENLRIASGNNNQHNKPLQKNNTSGFKNVVWNKQCNKWQVIVMLNKKHHHGGLFNNKEDANIAAIKFREELHSGFANHGDFKL